ncbi:hypothetical protein CerSpe_190760 [Prunus speciosa]
MTDGFRFSNVPDEVAHRILSFLAITDLTRFGCVSKRCRELPLSAPSLDFDLSTSDYTFASTCEKRIQLLNYLDSFLCRHGDNKIQRFRVRLECHCVEKKIKWMVDKTRSFRIRREACECRKEYSRIVRWVEIAVRRGVEVLHLEIFIDEKQCGLDSLVPSCVFLCGSLKTLELDFGMNYPKVLKKPSSSSFSSNLQRLDLRNIEIHEGVFEWMSSSCKGLKELSLDNCRAESITIQSSSLESFRYIYDDDDLSDFDIIAPNLKCVAWKANMFVFQNVEKCTRLEKVELLLQPQKHDALVLFEILRGISTVKHLTLNHETTMVLFEGGSTPALENVSYLCLNIYCLCDILVPAMASLFRGIPNLTTLAITSIWPDLDNCSEFDTRYWKSLNLAFVHKLEELDIHMLIGSNAVEFAKYVLEHAQKLKKMRIVHTAEQSKVLRRVNESKKISDATLVFEEAEE